MEVNVIIGACGKSFASASTYTPSPDYKVLPCLGSVCALFLLHATEDLLC